MTDTETHSITPAFWAMLAEIRSISRLVLAALAEDDIEEVERLSRDCARLMAEIKPIIEARSGVAERNDDDLHMRELLAELARMNERILEEISSRREEVRAELGRIHDGRLRLVHYRNTADAEPEMLDISG